MKRNQRRSEHAPRYEGVAALLAQADAGVEREDFETASQLLEKALELEPSNALLHEALGKVRLAMRNYPAAESLFRAAMRLDPQSASAAAGIVRVRLAAGRLTESEAVARSFVSQFPDDLVLGQLLAKILTDQRRIADAINQLRALHASHPESSETLNSLGKRLSELGQFDESRQCFERSIELDRANSFGYLGWVQSKTVRSEDMQIVEAMESVRRTRSYSDYDRMLLLFALGKAYGDLGDFAKSMEAYREANEIRDRESNRKQPFREELFESFLSLTREVFTEKTFRDHEILYESTPTPIFICGMFRSGTTLVEQILSSHSLVAAGGENDYWLERGTACLDFRRRTFDFARAQALRGPYQRALKAAAEGKPFITDKMPGNYRHIGLLRILYPKAKFIHCRRIPIATCLSIYMTSFKSPPNYASSPEKLSTTHAYYRQIMEHWQSVLGDGSIFEVRYEQLIDDPASVSKQMLNFCGLEFEESCLSPEKNRLPIQTASAWQARQPIYRSSKDKWRNYEPWLNEFRKLVDLEN